MAARDAEKKVVEESPAEKESGAGEVDGRELTAPPGWRKKLMPKKVGTPRRNDVVFISPTGEELKTKRKLDIYLRSHPENPPSSEFDWGTGQTPRRSARISQMAKATENPERGKPRKRERKASSNKAENEKKDSDSATEAPAAQEDAKVEAGDATVEDTGAVDEEIKSAEGVEKSKEEASSAETAVKERPENIEDKIEELEEGSKVALADAEMLPPATDSALKEMKDCKVPEDVTHKDNDSAVPKDAPSVIPDDGQHQPRSTPHNC